VILQEGADLTQQALIAPAGLDERSFAVRGGKVADGLKDLTDPAVLDDVRVPVQSILIP
jgi:hypothetical protein